MELMYVLIDAMVVLGLIVALVLYAVQVRRLSSGLLKKVFNWFAWSLFLFALFFVLANTAELVPSWATTHLFITDVLHLLALLGALCALRSGLLFVQFTHRYGFHQKVIGFVRHHSVKR